ncbi:MAG: hypothetical protein EOO62_28100 [Hymenobacter sp.]|nr:MAG: hypothetical protein EOO62_28100 [Hymenobacter sp.]
MRAPDLLNEVQAAFADVPRPGEQQIIYDNRADYPGVASIRDSFKHHPWQQLPPEVLAQHQDGFIFLSDPGLHYYLPAYLQFAIQDYAAADSIPDSLVYFLTLPIEADVVLTAFVNQRYGINDTQSAAEKSADYQDRLRRLPGRVHQFISRNSHFTAWQARAILHFLEHVRDEHSEEYLHHEPSVAIERYWFQFA